MIASNKDKWIRCRASDSDLQLLKNIQDVFCGDMSYSDIIRNALRVYFDHVRRTKPEPQLRRAHVEQLHVDLSCV